ncbi:hypothetical protein BD289DRAFT_376660 [Coniella lustricola]|uniref:Uncharacterized protein n=1 Tax=Coniella lustricola TaxID=2025994 RepID=A0A2T2ZWK5_9PEZI|nr:hypothetical protein BD289DRAFT_376660 [Coniella lustricola]
MAVTSRQTVRLAPDGPTSSPPTSPPPSDARPTTPTSPVQIPTRTKNAARVPLHRTRRDYNEPRHRSNSPRWRDTHSPDAIPPSVAALLAVTTIPLQRRSSRPRATREREQRLTVESFLHSQDSEKELSLNFIKGPLDVLLSPPDDLGDGYSSTGEDTLASPMSTRTLSCDSVPSLADSFSTEAFSSIESPQSLSRGRRVRPTRRSLTPVSSPPGGHQDHPLYRNDTETEGLDLTVFDTSPESDEKKGGQRMFGPFRSAFKSNLTASLRALRNAARSISSMNMSSIPPEDFLTRSLLTMEPNVPFTDERRPPTLEEEPSAAVRRYLNPTQTARFESQASSLAANSHSAFTASIQMQTYKVHRSRSTSPGSRVARSGGEPASRSKEAVLSFPHGPRQREMRDNSDFIRVAVMEMAMRRNGKLDDQRPGRARWALPPRKATTKPYEIGADGVPARWVAVTIT